MVTAYRLTKTRHVPTAFDGEGARLYGGRWNSVGTRMVYTAASRSLALLEILVHTEDVAIIADAYSIIPISFPEHVVMQVGESELPADWASQEPTAQTQAFGDRWVCQARSVVLEVPSAVTNEERNYLINPTHPEFPMITVGAAAPFRIDSRLG